METIAEDTNGGFTLSGSKTWISSAPVAWVLSPFSFLMSHFPFSSSPRYSPLHKWCMTCSYSLRCTAKHKALDADVLTVGIYSSYGRDVNGITKCGGSWLRRYVSFFTLSPSHPTAPSPITHHHRIDTRYSFLPLAREQKVFQHPPSSTNSPSERV
jgi:hypothetical protein